MYCTQLRTQLYTAVVQLDTTCTHYAWISCTVVHLYRTPVSVHLYTELVLTNESPSRITFMSRFDQSKLRRLGIAFPTTSQLNRSMLTTSAPKDRDFFLKVFFANSYADWCLEGVVSVGTVSCEPKQNNFLWGTKILVNLSKFGNIG